MEIKNIGSFHAIDQHGYIVNPATYPVLQQEYKEAVEYVLAKIENILNQKIHSVYLRGSVAKGIAIPFISDIDVLVITNLQATGDEQEQLEKVKQTIITLFPFVTKLELMNELLLQTEKKWLRFLLKTACVCIAGINLIPEIEPFKINDHNKGQLHAIVKQLQEFEQELATIDDNDIENIKDGCTWIMKAILRAGFELVMERDQSYTRDLFPCYERFSKYYPEHEPAMRLALQLAIEPTADKSVLIKMPSEMKPFFEIANRN